ncbi:hypothetical protein [Microbispora sp. NPDC046933]|uniref:hypothetical protein n=1 Tax=Microbispora sp. NPDC046933 TaxID=3155618 RepID=UPI0033EC4D15
MILISAALVLAAIVLLIAGVVLGTPPLVMWSIVVSVLSAVCLLIGALLRRHELFPAGGRAAAGTAPTPQGSSVPQLAHVGAVSGAYGGALAGAPAHPVATPMVAAPPVTHHGAMPPQTFPSPPPQRTGPITRPPAGSGRGLAPDAIVLVIPGRKRFHLATCRQLAGRETEELTHEEAREEGFTPCTTCLPETSTRTAEPEEAPLRDDTARDAVRDESLRAEAAPTTPTSPAGTSGTTDQEPPRPTPADREPPVARFPQPGVPGSRLPESSSPQSSGPQSSGPQSSVPGVSGPAAGAAGAAPAAAPSASGPSTAGPSEPADDEAREEPRETPGKASGETTDADEADPQDGPADDTVSEADGETEGDGHTPVNWFGRGTQQESGSTTPAPGPAASTPPSSPSPSSSAASSGSSSGSSAPSWPSATSWSAPAWSPPAAGSASGPADDETDESLTDTAEHDWFRPGQVSRPWDPARSRPAAGEAAKETPSSGDGESGGTAAGDKAPGAAAASPQRAPSSPVDDEQARDDHGDSGAADAQATSRPEDAPTPPRAGTGKPVEPAETPGSGRAGSAASAGSTSGPAPAAESTAEKGAGTRAEKTGPAGEEDGAGKGDGAAAAADAEKAATPGPGDADTDGETGENRGESGSATRDDRTADAAESFAGGDTPVRVMVGTRRYHTGDCPLISGMGDSGIETMTRAEADEAGLTPCSVCQNG